MIFCYNIREARKLTQVNKIEFNHFSEHSIQDKQLNFNINNVILVPFELT